MRYDRLNHAWQGDMLKNLTDFFKRQHHTADPEICKILLRDMPKKQHRPHRPAVVELFQKSTENGEQKGIFLVSAQINALSAQSSLSIFAPKLSL